MSPSGPGRLIAIVGPSGVGKDTLMAGMAAARPGLHLVRRVITRDPSAGGEPCEAVTEAEFAARRAAGAFCLHWQAHGLHYGIPQAVRARVAGGEVALVNLSRGVLSEARAAFPQLAVLNVTARPETLAARLAGRGRESVAEIALRLARADKPLPEGVVAIRIANDGPLEETVARTLRVLFPVSA